MEDFDKRQSNPNPSNTGHNEVDLSLDLPAGHNLHRQDTDKIPPSAKPTVHYPDQLAGDPSPGLYFNSPPAHSRAPSLAGTDDEDFEQDDFDWSGDEELEEEEAKFEKRAGVKVYRRRWGPLRVFTFLFSTLIGSVLLAGIIATPAILVNYYWYLPDPTPHRRYVKANIEAWLFWAAANIVISWGLAMIVDVVPVFTRFAISLSWGHVSEEMKNHIELYDSIKGTFKPLLYAAEAWLSWVIIFANIYELHNMDPDVASWASYTDRLYQVIEFLFFFALVICVQKMLSHAIAFAFHRTAYKERLDEVHVALRAIETLRNYKPKLRHRPNKSGGGHTPMFSFGGMMTPFSEKEHFDFVSNKLRSASPAATDISDAEADVEDGGEPSKKGKGKKRPDSRGLATTPTLRLNDSPTGTPASENPEFAAGGSPVSPLQSPKEKAVALAAGGTHKYPPTPPSRRRSADNHDEEANAVRQAAKAIRSAVLHDARNVKGKEADISGAIFGVGSNREAKRLARAIYNTFRDRKRRYLIAKDFERAFPSEEAARQAFRVFDRDNNGDIQRAEIKSTLLNVYKERRFLSRSMRDAGVALRTLDNLLLFFALVILFFISLSIFGVNVTKSLTSVYSLGIAASFVFKNAASNAFDAIMFLFVTHPFDTGDRVFINQENLVVKKMGLFATVFARIDGTETYYFNSQLFTQFITNVRRSDKMAEYVTLNVAWRTPQEKLDELVKCINDWLAREENRWFQPSTGLTPQAIVFQRHYTLSMTIPHNSNWQDWGLKNAAHTAFQVAVQYYCNKLGITAYESPMPIVFADPQTGRYQPRDWGRPEADKGSDAASTTSVQEQPREDSERPPVPKTILGFTPPDDSTVHLTRARKSRRDAALRTAGGGGDG
ncbi:hypothetical protein CONPUDRAFT_54256 [Coniophora puteana RWD-64-598 SS2]|uniref:EF-hand domain-containing protein n=1 Tax=Coniophora puteana (strain RWD-64-598) TaxID=741705 RepID=A0A5M3MTW5_CONPW|nr:uncharacterized protein CONPUDRAFT_54256 [Coniophora puteana RWD-64-598 SS2]EIW82487.1 hypothetical protein CONPUDRAFT_54256 [Coniophora puteana RWD-64-598 SS2]